MHMVNHTKMNKKIPLFNIVNNLKNKITVDYRGHCETLYRPISIVKDAKTILTTLIFLIKDVDDHVVNSILKAYETGIPSKHIISSDKYIDTCFVCGEDMCFSFNGVNLTVNSDCPFPNGMPEYSIEMSIPSGKLVIANDLRYLFKHGEYNGRSFDLNTYMGCRETFEVYGKLGMAHGFIGNTCPGVYRVDENTLTISKIRCDDELDACEDEFPGEPVAGICTDLWWYSIVDYDNFVKRAGKIPDNKRCDVISVKPGVYKITHRFHLIPEYSNITDHYAIIKWIKNIY